MKEGLPPLKESELEQELISMLLDGDDPILEVLRKQHEAAKISSRVDYILKG